MYSVRRQLRLDPSKGDFMCDECGEYFLSPGYLDAHKKRIHQQQSRGECTVCNLGFETGQYLKKHIKTTHGEWARVPVRCSQCGAEFQSVDRLARHATAHFPPRLACRYCSKEFSLKQNLRRHEAYHRGSPNQFTCPFCFKSCSQVGGFSQHISRCHLGGNEGVQSKCPFCGQLFPSKNDYSDHLSKHFDEFNDKGLVKCTFCSRNFMTTRLCDEHCTRVHGREDFKCPLCGEAFPDPKLGIRHLKLHDEVKDREFRCSDCDNTFESIPILVRHRVIVHPLAVKLDGTVDKIPSGFMDYVTCDVCGCQSLTRKKHLRHVRDRHKTVAVASNLAAESEVTSIVSESDLVFNYCCSLCTLATFASYADLTKHYSAYHEEATVPVNPIGVKAEETMTKIVAVEEEERRPESAKKILQCGKCKAKLAVWSDFVRHLGRCQPNVTVQIHQLDDGSWKPPPRDDHFRSLKKMEAMDAYVTRVFGSKKRKTPPEDGEEGQLEDESIGTTRRGVENFAKNDSLNSEESLNMERSPGAFSVLFSENETRSAVNDVNPLPERHLSCGRCTIVLRNDAEAYEHAREHCGRDEAVLYVVVRAGGFKVVDTDYLFSLTGDGVEETADGGSSSRVTLMPGTTLKTSPVERAAAVSSDREDQSLVTDVNSMAPVVVVAISKIARAREKGSSTSNLPREGSESMTKVGENDFSEPPKKKNKPNDEFRIDFVRNGGELECLQCRAKIASGEMLRHARSGHNDNSLYNNTDQLTLVYRQGFGFSVVNSLAARKFAIGENVIKRAFVGSQLGRVRTIKSPDDSTNSSPVLPVKNFLSQEQYAKLDRNLEFPPSRHSILEGFRLNFVKLSDLLTNGSENKGTGNNKGQVWCPICALAMSEEELVSSHLDEHNENDDLYLDENRHSFSAYNERARSYDERRRKQTTTMLETGEDRQDIARALCQLAQQGSSQQRRSAGENGRSESVEEILNVRGQEPHTTSRREETNEIMVQLGGAESTNRSDTEASESQEESLHVVLETVSKIDKQPLIKLINGSIVLEPRGEDAEDKISGIRSEEDAGKSSVNSTRRNPRSQSTKQLARQFNRRISEARKTSKQYLEVKANEEELRFACHVCRESFEEFASFTDHVRDKHNAEESRSIFYCDKCPKVFDKKGYLKKHLQYYHQIVGELPPCPMCRVSFQNLTELGRHMTQHKRELGVVHAEDGALSDGSKIAGAFVNLENVTASEHLFRNDGSGDSTTDEGQGRALLDENFVSFSKFENESECNRMGYNESGCNQSECSEAENWSGGKIFQCSECECYYETLNEALKHVNEVHGGGETPTTDHDNGQVVVDGGHVIADKGHVIADDEHVIADDGENQESTAHPLREEATFHRVDDELTVESVTSYDSYDSKEARNDVDSPVPGRAGTMSDEIVLLPDDSTSSTLTPFVTESENERSSLVVMNDRTVGTVAINVNYIARVGETIQPEPVVMDGMSGVCIDTMAEEWNDAECDSNLQNVQVTFEREHCTPLVTSTSNVFDSIVCDDDSAGFNARNTRGGRLTKYFQIAGNWSDMERLVTLMEDMAKAENSSLKIKECELV